MEWAFRKMSKPRQNGPKQFFKARQGDSRRKANVVNKEMGNDEAENLFVTICLSTSEKKLTWVVDNGCSNHMPYNEWWFRKLDKNFRMKMMIRNGSYMDVEDKEKVVMHSQR